MKIPTNHNMTDAAVKTARRIFEIFEYYDTVQRPLSLKEVVTQFRYPPSSASALLKSMVVLGYLDYDRYSRTYMPTMRMATLGNWVQGVLFGEGRVLQLMHQLHQLTQETIALGAQSDLYAQYVHTIPSTLPFSYSIPPGTIRRLAGSGIGHLLLSARSDSEIEKLVRRINNEARQPEDKVHLPTLMARIAEVRADGYIFSKHTVTRGGGVIAMLLPKGRFGRLFALGVLGPVERLEEQQDAILAALRKGIRQYGRTLKDRPAGSGRRAERKK